MNITPLDPFNQLPAPLQTILISLSRRVSKVAVTGPGGFLGKALCTMLRSAGIEVVGFSRNAYPELTVLGVQHISGDLSDYSAIERAFTGCDLVFHVASKAGVWGDKESYFKPNVLGTEHVISACRALNIKHLVYTSTPSVTFDGADEVNIDESQPYASQFLNFYGLSKAIAEQKILAANSAQLQTVALRPHLIWGPGDPHLAPRVIQRAIAGRLKLVGKTDKLIDTIYIDNAVYAHLLAANALFSDQPKCAGKAYFLSNEQPITMAEMLNKILDCNALPPVTKRVPTQVAYAVGYLLEKLYKLINKQEEPIMTRFVARQLSTSHYYNINAAKQDLHYRPLISIEHGMQQLKKSLN